MAVRFSEKEYRELIGGKEPSHHNKYRNQKVTLDGITFDSVRERDRYAELKLLLRSGAITDLKLQPVFELVPAIRKNGKLVQRAVTYRADFSYRQDGELVVEDAKGVRTDVYVLKRKLMMYIYDIEVKEI